MNYHFRENITWKGEKVHVIHIQRTESTLLW